MVQPRPPSLWTAAAVACLLSCGPASAQTAGDPRLQNPRIQSAYSEWRKLPQKEVDCVDQTLRTRRSSLWLTIQRGVNPADAAVAAIRTACRAQARVSNPAGAGAASQMLGGSQALAASAEARADEAARLAAERAAAAKAAAEKTAAEKVAAEKAAANKLAAEKAAADKLAADKAAADADKLAADKLAADKLAAEEQMAAKAAMDRLAAEKEQPAMDPAKDNEAPVNAGAIKTATDAARAPLEAVKMTAEAALSFAAAESRISFVYGLISGPAVFSFGGVVFLLLRRKKPVAAAPPRAAHAGHSRRDDQRDFDRLVAAVLAELAQREGKHAPPAALHRQHAADEAPVH